MKGFFVHYGMYKPGVGTERKQEGAQLAALCVGDNQPMPAEIALRLAES